METLAKPAIATAEEWQRARDDLLRAEKEATRALDALAATSATAADGQVRRDYVFDASTGPTTLVDLFEGRDQLAVYQFMDLGPDAFCPGCTHFTNNVTDLGDLAETGVSWATVSDMPLAQIEAAEREMGLDDAVRVLARHHVLQGLRRGRRLHADRVPPRRRRRVPHLLDHRARRRPRAVRQQHPRPVPLRSPGGLGGLACQAGRSTPPTARADRSSGRRRRSSRASESREGGVASG